jgi:hypothetical protein
MTNGAEILGEQMGIGWVGANYRIRLRIWRGEGRTRQQRKLAREEASLPSVRKSRCMTPRWGTPTVHPCFRSELQPSQASKRQPTAQPSSNQNVGLDFHNPLSETSTPALNRIPFSPPSYLTAVIEITHLVSQSRDSFILLDSGDGNEHLLCTVGTFIGNVIPQSSRLGTTFHLTRSSPIQLAIMSTATSPIFSILRCNM